MLAKNKMLIGLDVGSSVVKAVEVAGDKNRLTVVGYGSAPIEKTGVEAAISAALKNGKITSRRVATAISGRKVVVRYFDLPNPMDPKAQREYVEREAANYIPFDLNEVEKDYYAVETAEGDNKKARVILVASKKDEIETRYHMLRSCGLIPVAIDIDTFAMGNAFEYWLSNSGGNVGKVSGLVDVGASKTTINIVQGTTSNFSREVYIGSNDMRTAVMKRMGQSEAEADKAIRDSGDNTDQVREALTPVLEDIGNEIRLSIDFYENQFDVQVADIYVSGGILKFSGLVDALGSIFFLPTQTWYPLEHALRDTSDSELNNRLRNDATQLPVAVGLAVRILKRT